MRLGLEAARGLERYRDVEGVRDVEGYRNLEEDLDSAELRIREEQVEAEDRLRRRQRN